MISVLIFSELFLSRAAQIPGFAARDRKFGIDCDAVIDVKA
jgi:hypothetical protein